MAQPWACDSNDGNSATLAITNLGNGEVMAFCADCAPDALHALADGLSGKAAPAPEQPAETGPGDDNVVELPAQPETAPAPENAQDTEREGGGPDTPARPFPGGPDGPDVTPGPQRAEPTPARSAAAPD